MSTPAARSRSPSCLRLSGPSAASERSNDLGAPLDLGLADAVLAESPMTVREPARGGEGLKPGIVLAADEVERAAAEPGDDERAVLGEGAVDVGGGQAGGASADGEAKPARILPLYGEQPLGDATGSRAGRPASS